MRAHILLCTLAYYVEWHMSQVLAPLLFDDDAPAAARRRGLQRWLQPNAPRVRGARPLPNSPPITLRSIASTPCLSELATVA
jgi:hypothetical protein